MSQKRQRSKKGSRKAGVGLWLAIFVGAAVVLTVAFAALQPSRPNASQDAGMRIGAPAPTTSLQATTGREVSLASYRGRPVVLFFYEGAT